MVLVLVFSAGCSGDGESGSDAGGTTPSVNRAAYIPPECYAKTTDGAGKTYNNCYVCHSRGKMPNLTGDDDLQLEYAFPAYAQKNHWLNLFKDRSEAIAAIDDGRITDYIRQSNYLDHDGTIVPAQQIEAVPAAWDSNADGHWSGYVPDCYFSFDKQGFDRDPQGDITGWRAFAYYPFPSTHWPANGSMSDVIIRLPEAFRQMNGTPDQVAYKINLAVLEALFKQTDVPIDTVDETLYGVDLNKDGILSLADHVVYDWAPIQGRTMSYVGDAKEQQEQGAVHLAANLYPEGTEFINTLRYIDSDDSGQIVMAARMKELRYARKTKWLTYSQLETLALDERKERDDFPDRLRLPMGHVETGLSNGKGWALGGFIEDAQGNLRPQTSEELSACTGCHGGLGITADSTFAFARKLDSTAYRKGWFHWSQKSLKGINEPKIEIKKAGLQYEYCFYLMYNRGADALRSNDEAAAAFLDEQGFLKTDMAERLHDDISLLLHPSAERSLALNKAYYLIVREQSYTMGREPLLKPAENTHETIETADIDTKIKEPAVMTVQAVDPQCDHCLDIGTPAVGDALQTAIIGIGMTGPDGTRYDADWSGLIDISNYALDVPGAYFPFPRRHTLPTRMIVPNMATQVCYNCHRLPAPQPPSDPKLTLPVPIPATAENEPSLSMARLTDDTNADIGGEWSPDGARIAWVSNRSGRYQIWTMNADGSNKIQVTPEPATHGWPRWSPDSTRLVYWRHDPATGNHSIITSRADGSNVKTITTSDDYLDKPAWHPNGQAIAYAAVTDGNWDVWVADVAPDRIDHYRITQDPDMETTPLWSPDGSAICYKVAPSGEYSLTIQRIASFEHGYTSPAIHQWQSTQAIQMYDWSPDGSRIAYTAEILTNASGEDRISYAAVVEDVAIADGEITPGMPVNLSNHNTLGDRGPVFSPDGRRAAFWAWDKSYRATLWVANIDGSHLKQVTTQGFDMYPRWRPDGKALLFESGRSGNMDIWIVDLAE
jgi:Tol biopolymer transport system component